VRPSLAAAADRAVRALLPLLLVALLVSINAVRVLAALLLAAFVVARVAAPGRRPLRLPLVAPLAAFAAVTMLSALVSPEPAHALLQSRHLLYLALFFVSVNTLRDGDDARAALRWLFAGATAVSLYAIAQAAVCHGLVPWPAGAGWLLSVDVAACRRASPFRPAAFLDIYMTLAGTLLVTLALLLARLTERGAAEAARPGAAALPALVALGLTYARQAWVGLGVAVGVLVALSRRLWLVLGLVLLLVAGVGVSAGFRAKVTSMVDPQSESARERFYYWDAGLRMFRDAPLLGVGPGRARREYPRYKHPAAVNPHTPHLHSNLVQIAAERGALGLLAWLWIWIAFFRAVEPIRRVVPAGSEDRALVTGSVAAVAGFLAGGLFEYNFGDPHVIDLLWIVMALPFVVPARACPPRPAAATAPSPFAPR
jgi:O-antigen ligase